MLKDNFALQIINKQIERTAAAVKDYTNSILEYEEALKGFTISLRESEQRLASLLDAAKLLANTNG
jgi:hypothetical protein